MVEDDVLALMRRFDKHSTGKITFNDLERFFKVYVSPLNLTLVPKSDAFRDLPRPDHGFSNTKPPQKAQPCFVSPSKAQEEPNRAPAKP